MSYSFGTDQPASKSDVVEALRTAAAAQREVVHPDVQAEFDEHVDKALAHLPALLEVVGSPEALVSVHLAGHANPGHGKAEGWADEMLNVSVSVIEPE